ncbi:hypothetical protein KIN20_009003 [Parelaphostrongylus tenuis]|uniref:Uncharacterized protein n=1 Tax=Parelaphostrongylus tenuis TaxID=148309 RepID=A0AAD5MRY5_PARTN|nr:hypothetical protein KIN20_009003 [Parelaphostrongylus tenuis]
MELMHDTTEMTELVTQSPQGRNRYKLTTKTTIIILQGADHHCPRVSTIVLQNSDTAQSLIPASSNYHILYCINCTQFIILAEKWKTMNRSLKMVLVSACDPASSGLKRLLFKGTSEAKMMPNRLKKTKKDRITQKSSEYQVLEDLMIAKTELNGFPNTRTALYVYLVT